MLRVLVVEIGKLKGYLKCMSRVNATVSSSSVSEDGERKRCQMHELGISLG
jgi:hypothetical protein